MTYLFQAAAEDEASQELGLVFIFMLGKAPASADDSNVTLQALSRIVQCAPVRVGAFHICSPDRPEFHTAKDNIVNSLSRQERLRTRIHHGEFVISKPPSHSVSDALTAVCKTHFCFFYKKEPLWSARRR